MIKNDCRKRLFSLVSLAIIVAFILGNPMIGHAQVILQGYIFESGNRGYLEEASVTILDNSSKAIQGESLTDENGKFEVAVSAGKEYLIRVNKKPFEPMEQVVSAVGKSDGEKIFSKFEMKRLPGYVFEVTLAPTREDDDVVVDAITGAWIEVYNNTTDKEELSLKDHPNHTFSCRFEQGNHYTVLIRKDGFYNKRLEAYVNVKGCILCFDGVGEVKPGVSEVLTEGFAMGTLLANVELQPISMNKEVEINNIYYESNSAKLNDKSKEELDKLVQWLKDNSNLLVEIGSHTDSRGETKANQVLSLARAKSVVEYLAGKGITKERMTAVGYGESKLRNSCGNDVECPEAKHAKNRRTEFKVIGFVHQNLVDNRSLMQMKEGERMDKIIAELEGSEIKIPAGGAPPKDLQKQLKQKPSASEVKPQPTEEALLEKQKTKEQELPAVKQTEPKPVNTTSPVVQKKEESPSPKEVKVNNPVTVIDNKDSVVEEKVENVVEEEKKPIIKDMLAEVKAFEDRMLAEDEAVGMTMEREVTQANYIQAPKSLPLDYSGYKIQIVISTYELPLSHEIFSRHGNLLLEETQKGTYAYLLGSFNNEVEANEFLNNVLISKYPNARVVPYLNGKRVVE
jgi:outer membrane protein OmpA-like peptidoglycan-associated protein